MALNQATFNSNFDATFLDVLAVDKDGETNKFKLNGEPDVTLTVTAGGSFSYGQLFADSYHAYAAQGVVIGLAPGSLSFTKSFLKNVMDGGGANAATFATALAQFWNSTSGTQVLACPGGVTLNGYSNNALSKVGAFQSAITASIDSSAITDPIYANFFTATEPVVKSIIWTFNEITSAPSNISCTGTIS